MHCSTTGFTFRFGKGRERPKLRRDQYEIGLFSPTQWASARVLTGLLRSKGHRVVTVTPGVRFARIDEQSYSLNPPAANQYLRLFEALEKTDKMPAQIVHLWSVTNDGGAMSVESFAETQETGFLSLVRIAKALIARNVTWPLHIDVVSNQVQTVDGNEGLAPAKATLLGPCKCIPQEYPNLRCRSIDVASFACRNGFIGRTDLTRSHERYERRSDRLARSYPLGSGI